MQLENWSLKTKGKKMEIMKVNGWNVLFHNNNSEIANIRFVVNAGSAQEDGHGEAHFAEHMFFKGTKNKTYKDLNKIIYRLGNTNAYTDYDRTVYHITCLSKNIEAGMNVLSEMFFDSTLPEKEIELEKGVIKEECQTRLDSPNTWFYESVITSLYGETSGHQIVGNHDSIDKINRDGLLNFKDRFYNQNNVLLSVVGNIDKSELISCLNFPAQDGSKSKNVTIDLNLLPFETTHNSKQAGLQIVYKGKNSFDLKSHLSKILLTNIMGGGLYSLLATRIREELGLCYSIAAYTERINNKSSLHVSCSLSSKNIEKTIGESLKIIDKVKSEGVPNDLLETAKDNISFQYVSIYNNSSSLNALLADNHFYEMNHLNSLSDIINTINNISNSDLKELANEIFTEYKICTLNK